MPDPTDLTHCPHCKANLVDEPIPENRRHHFGGATHGSRLVAIYDSARDRTSHFQCPDCGGIVERDGSIERTGFRTHNVIIVRDGREGVKKDDD